MRIKNRERLTQNVILYLIKKLKDKTEGRKKVMKLMFLIEHYNLKSGKIEKKSLLGNKYLIYYYGVFSFEVMKSYNKLLKDGKIKEGLYPVASVNEVRLPEKIKEKINKIIHIFGNKHGYELEVLTLKKMGIEPYEKSRFFGKSINEIIS